MGNREIEAFVRSWTMIPAKDGLFEVVLNDELIFSKKALGRHAEPGEVRHLIEERLVELRG